jgi:hypothetical protein
LCRSLKRLHPTDRSIFATARQNATTNLVSGAGTGTVAAAPHPRRHGCNEAGQVELIGEDEAAVGCDRGQRDLDHRVAYPLRQLGSQLAYEDAD